MIIYIEDSIIENFFVTFLLLMCINKIFCIKPKRLKLVIVSLFAGVVATTYPIINFSNFALIVFKLCFGFLIIYMMYQKNKIFAKYIIFIFLTALYAGLNILIYYIAFGTLNITDNFPTFILLVILYVIYYLVISCINLLKKNFTISNFVYSIKIINNNLEIIDTAFLDSGNTLVDNLDNSPIFVINFKIFHSLYPNVSMEDILCKNFKSLKDAHYVKSNFASGSSKMLVFSVDCLEINSNNNTIKIKNAKLGLCYSKFYKNFNCNMLLNINAFCKTHY